MNGTSGRRSNRRREESRPKRSSLTQLPGTKLQAPVAHVGFTAARVDAQLAEDFEAVGTLVLDGKGEQATAGLQGPEQALPLAPVPTQFVLGAARNRRLYGEPAMLEPFPVSRDVIDAKDDTEQAFSRRLQPGLAREVGQGLVQRRVADADVHEALDAAPARPLDERHEDGRRMLQLEPQET